jgi:hypothetical protein
MVHAPCYIKIQQIGNVSYLVLPTCWFFQATILTSCKSQISIIHLKNYKHERKGKHLKIDLNPKASYQNH